MYDGLWDLDVCHPFGALLEWLLAAITGNTYHRRRVAEKAGAQAIA